MLSTMYNLIWPPYTSTCTSILSVYLCSDLVRPRTYLKFLFFLFAWGIQRHQVGGITRRACIRFNGCYKASDLLEPSRWPQNQSVFSAFSLSVFSLYNNEHRHPCFAVVLCLSLLRMVIIMARCIMTGTDFFLAYALDMHS
jgi:hypothetical protein